MVAKFEPVSFNDIGTKNKVELNAVIPPTYSGSHGIIPKQVGPEMDGVVPDTPITAAHNPCVAVVHTTNAEVLER